MDHLNGYMYHMSHFNNLRSILEEGALLSQENLDKKNVKVRSIANQEVQNLRKRIYVWSFSENRYRPLHSYVPFYFAPHTPMLRNQQTAGIHNDLVFFEVSRAYIGTIDHSVLFTDGNASNQQLSKFGNEEVYITPATLSASTCQRKYSPINRPYGTNNRRSNFYADEAFLDRISWNVIDGSTFVDDREEYTRLKHAEVLAPDLFPLDEMINIIVSTNEIVRNVKILVSELGIILGQYDIKVICRPSMFV